MLNVSVDSIQRARIVETEGIPELVQAVENGKLDVTNASSIARLDESKQAIVLEMDDKEILKMAKQIRKTAMSDRRKKRLDAIEQKRANNKPLEAAPGKVRRKWCHFDGEHHSKNGQGPGDAPDQPQQVVQLRQDAREGGARSGRQWWGGRTIATFSPSAEIDEQIRALSIQLNDCPLGSLEAKAISDQLNVLQGVKQSQYGAPSPAKKFKLK